MGLGSIFLIACYDLDYVAQHLLSKLSLDSSAEPHFSLTDGVLRYDGKIWLGSYTTLHSKVFPALHSSALSGHSGAPTTYRSIKQLFYWPHMKYDILAWVQSCAICQQAKPERSKYPRLLEPLPIPTASWEVVSMDFVEGLPQSGSANAILVVVDQFSKFSHFIPLHHPFIAATIA